MRAFATYIEYLLATRHYCYVPGHGAYMLAEEPASLSGANGTMADTPVFAAPRRVVRFSSLHHHDDGLLVNLLMEAEGMSYDAACRYIERQAPLLTDQFLQDSARLIDIEHFGFNDLHVDTWAAIEQKKAWAAAAVEGPALIPNVAPTTHVKPSADTKEDSISIPKYWIRRAAAILLIIVCFFSNFLGLNDRGTEQQLAAVLDITTLQRNVMVHQSWDDEDEELLDEELAEGEYLLEGEEDDMEESEDDLLAAYDALEAEKSEAEKVAVVPAPVQPAPAPQATSITLPKSNLDKDQAMAQSSTGDIFYIIVASCSSEEDANRALGNLSNDGYNNVALLKGDGHFRLYINVFAERREAESYLYKLRGIQRFHNAWLLPVSGSSLSHIIKNTYNDNQLSMELSHLNQRTERDQG